MGRSRGRHRPRGPAAGDRAPERLPDAARRHPGRRPRALRAGRRPQRGDRRLRARPVGDPPAARGPRHEPGAVRGARGVLMRLIAETARHAGHAGTLRGTLDGRTST
ncbi:DUF664 domain-containing protein [Streptomyces sp. NPDC018972]|uniref:mycothiol transferase n=1 Tax=Streptomyces sp. NPDC018972 TaxID=3365060 RepID=UPI0037A2542D